jgi:hypothetical protein
MIVGDDSEPGDMTINQTIIVLIAHGADPKLKNNKNLRPRDLIAVDLESFWDSSVALGTIQRHAYLAANIKATTSLKPDLCMLIKDYVEMAQAEKT